VAPRRTQRERRETTRRLLLDTARSLFARDGFAATSLEAVATTAGVTKGALYHHFAGKEQLFEAVYTEEQQRIAEELARTYESRRNRGPLDASYTSCRRFLEISQDPAVQRITLLDAPAALGWDRMREIESAYGLALMKDGIQNAIAAGVLKRGDVDSLAHLLFGALCEGAMYMARADDQRAAQRKVERQFKAILDGLVS
jgi:AcrR family transcriptional regulator